MASDDFVKEVESWVEQKIHRARGAVGWHTTEWLWNNCPLTNRFFRKYCRPEFNMPNKQFREMVKAIRDRLNPIWAENRKLMKQKSENKIQVTQELDGVQELDEDENNEDWLGF